MKIKIQPEHAGMLEINDWLGELQDGENAEPTGPLAPVALASPCRPAMPAS